MTVHSPDWTVDPFNASFQRFCIVEERKYFWDGDGSRTTDNVDPASVLGNPMSAVKQLPLDSIPQVPQLFQDSVEHPSGSLVNGCPGFVNERRRQKSLNVLKDCIVWALGFKDTTYLKEEGAPFVPESFALAGDAEGWAGEASAEEVMVWNLTGLDPSCV
jgi:hypothetical protein